MFSDIVVVDDGSQDGTASVAVAEGVAVISQKNQGKGVALAVGARSINTDLLFFADADLVGFTPRHIRDLIHPVQEGSVGMSVGLRDRGRVTNWLMMDFLPVIGGERVMSRDMFLHIVSHRAAQRFGLETVMNTYCNRHHVPVALIPMKGVSQIIKEKKYGLVRGVLSRVRMIGEMIHASICLFFDHTL